MENIFTDITLHKIPCEVSNFAPILESHAEKTCHRSHIQPLSDLAKSSYFKDHVDDAALVFPKCKWAAMSRFYTYYNLLHIFKISSLFKYT